MSNNRNHHHDNDQDQETGRSTPTRTPGTADGEAYGDEPLDEIGVTIVDDIQLQSESAAVSNPKFPQGDATKASSVKVSVATVGLQRAETSLDRVFRPQGPTRKQRGWAVTDASVDLVQESTPISTAIVPGQQHTKESIEIATTDVTLTQETERLETVYHPQAQLTSSNQRRPLFDDLEEKDPIFAWGGGSPYGSDRPLFVVHKDPGTVPALDHLQSVLRDTYKEFEGGEPGSDTAEFVANDLRIPQIQGRIVTLDLSEGEWEPDVRNGQPVIERGNIDLVPKLRELATTLFTGELGYLVVNVPAEWETKIRRQNFHERLVARIAGVDKTQITDGDTREGGVLEHLRSAPVVFAEPHVTEQEMFWSRVSSYHALASPNGCQSVRQLETLFERTLRANEWQRISLTTRQFEGEGESDRHYLWKAAIVDGFANAFWKAKGEDNERFSEFVQKELLPAEKGPIQTEYRVGRDDEQPELISDIRVETTNTPWVEAGCSDILTDDIEFPLAVEFETGFVEGAFNFRKVVESLDKYAENSDFRTVAVVVAPRLFYRGARRATMLQQLVTRWDERKQDSDAKAIIHVPEFDEGRCVRLQSGSALIDHLYQENK